MRKKGKGAKSGKPAKKAKKESRRDKERVSRGGIKAGVTVAA